MNPALTAMDNAKVLVFEAEARLVQAEGLKGRAYVEFCRFAQEYSKSARQLLKRVEEEIEEGLCQEMK